MEQRARSTDSTRGFESVGESAELRPFKRLAKKGALSVTLSGTHVWMLGLLIVGRESGFAYAPLSMASAGAAFAALSLGAWFLGRHDSLARWLLLAAFPCLLSMVLAFGLPDDGVALDPFFVGPLFVLAGFLLFGALAARAVAPSCAPLDGAGQTNSNAPSALAARRRVRWALVATVGAGAFCLGWIAPLMLRAGLSAAWEDAAREAEVLLAVVGGALGVWIVAAVVAPSLRLERGRKPSARMRWVRSAAWLVSAGAGAATWYVLEHR